MFAHPGQKTAFYGNGIWTVERMEPPNQPRLAPVLIIDYHKGLQFFMKDLNSVYKRFPALYENDFTGEGFKWIDANDAPNSILSFMRFDKEKEQVVIIVANFTPVPQAQLRIGVPKDTKWNEILNSDASAVRRRRHGKFWRSDCESGSISTEKINPLIFCSRPWE